MHRARRHQLCQKLCREFARTRLLRNASNFKRTFPFHFSTFIFYKVLSKILQHIEHIEIATTYLEIAKKNKIQTFFVKKRKTLHWFCRMHQTPQKDLKLSNLQFIKTTKSVGLGWLVHMCLINENRNEGFVGKSKMWKVKVSLTAAKWHLQSFVLMKLGGNRPKRVSNKTYFCQLLELVWSWQMPNFSWEKNMRSSDEIVL